VEIAPPIKNFEQVPGIVCLAAALALAFKYDDHYAVGTIFVGAALTAAASIVVGHTDVHFSRIQVAGDAPDGTAYIVSNGCFDTTWLLVAGEKPVQWLLQRPLEVGIPSGWEWPNFIIGVLCVLYTAWSILVVPLFGLYGQIAFGIALFGGLITALWSASWDGDELFKEHVENVERLREVGEEIEFANLMDQWAYVCRYGSANCKVMRQFIPDTRIWRGWYASMMQSYFGAYLDSNELADMKYYQEEVDVASGKPSLATALRDSIDKARGMKMYPDTFGDKYVPATLQTSNI